MCVSILEEGLCFSRWLPNYWLTRTIDPVTIHNKFNINKSPVWCMMYWTSYVVLFAIWYHSYNLKNVKNTHERVLFLVKLLALAVGVFHVFWIVHMVPNRATHHICTFNLGCLPNHSVIQGQSPLLEGNPPPPPHPPPHPSNFSHPWVPRILIVKFEHILHLFLVFLLLLWTSKY